jgi:hypothetical protein
MTMHMEKPYLTTTGKKKGKATFRSADAAHRARQCQESWSDLKEKYNLPNIARTPTQLKGKGTKYVPPQPYRRDTGPRYPSLDTGAAIAARAPDKVYTGDAMIGISVLHKSNGIPVFRDEDIKDISKMRRG